MGLTWKNYKNLGSWPFKFQQDKPFYNEGNLISNKDNPVWKMDFTGEPVTPTHNPCGYWPDPGKGPEFPSDPEYPSPSPFPPPDDCCEDVSIGYTTQQMSIDEQQALTVENPIAGCSYSWEIVSGGGSLSQVYGLYNVYTAPSANGDCEYNPVIELSAKVYNDLTADYVVCDSLAIAVNAYPNIVWATRVWSGKSCSEVVPGIFNCNLTNHTYDCAGDLMAGYPCLLLRQSSGGGASCGACYGKTFPSACYSGAVSINTLMASTPIDLRTDLIKAGGCCPEQLL